MQQCATREGLVVSHGQPTDSDDAVPEGPTTSEEDERIVV